MFDTTRVANAFFAQNVNNSFHVKVAICISEKKKVAKGEWVKRVAFTR